MRHAVTQPEHRIVKRQAGVPSQSENMLHSLFLEQGNDCRCAIEFIHWAASLLSWKGAVALIWMQGKPTLIVATIRSSNAARGRL